MNRRDIHLLQRIKLSPAVTITLPTQSAGPDDRLLVESLVKHASERLMAEYEPGEAEPLLLQLEKVAASIDYSHTQEGLAMFVNRDFFRAVHLPFTVKERVEVDKSFRTRELVFAMNRLPRYWTLVLSEKATRLFDGTRENLIEIKAGKFPLANPNPGGETPMPGSFGMRRSAMRDERLREFLRQVDGALKLFMTEDLLPLALVGLERYLVFFDEVTGHKDLIVASLTGSYELTSPQELSALVWPLVKAGLANRRLHVLADLNKAIREQKIASGVEQVWRLAKEGRGKFLLIEEDFRFPARLDEAGEHLLAAEHSAAPDVIDDGVDEIIEAVVSKGGQVVFVDNGRLAAHQCIALILHD